MLREFGFCGTFHSVWDTPVHCKFLHADLYSGLRRFLTFKNWASKTYTTAAHGLAQGDSFSLLAINQHMAVWAILVKRFPIECAVFIDDAYIWAKADRSFWLQRAIDVITKFWGSLVGQTLNDRKSQIWATSCEGMMKIRNSFPDMELCSCDWHIGVKSSNFRCEILQMGPQKVAPKSSRILKAIGALPCKNTDIHAHLIGMKVIPQIAFTPLSLWRFCGVIVQGAEPKCWC